MAAYLQLYNKQTGALTKFSDIDNELREHFQQPADPEKFLCGWYDSVGCYLAIGFDDTRIREILKDYEGLTKIYEYLIEHYDVNHWHGA